MPRFKISEHGPSNTIISIDPKTGRDGYYGPRFATNMGASYFLGCCGMAGIEKFDSCLREYGFDLSKFDAKAELLSILYRNLYSQGTVLYALTNKQLGNQLHHALLEVGSKEIAVFPNLYHGPNMMHLFKVNIRNVAGRFCKKNGDAYTEPPKDDAEIIPEQTEAGERGVYANINHHN